MYPTTKATPQNSFRNMATEYPLLKVPDLKKLLQERGLAVSGNKAELISRLVADDKKSKSNADEIDWDEDDKATSSGPVPPFEEMAQSEITVIQVEKVEEIPEKADDTFEVPKPEETVDAPESILPVYTIGLEDSDMIQEAEKRAARAKRFGISQDEEAIKLAERARKFGIKDNDGSIQGLDNALPERKPKRVREERGYRTNSRSEKRQASNNRAKVNPKNKTDSNKLAPVASDDPVEKSKAEARAKRFARPVVS